MDTTPRLIVRYFSIDINITLCRSNIHTSVLYPRIRLLIRLYILPIRTLHRRLPPPPPGICRQAVSHLHSHLLSRETIQTQASMAALNILRVTVIIVKIFQVQLIPRFKADIYMDTQGSMVVLCTL